MYLPAFIQIDLLSMLNLPTTITCSITARHKSILPMQFSCTLKGGLLSIATQELLLVLQSSPLALTMARDLAYQRRLSSLEGRDLRTYSACT